MTEAVDDILKEVEGLVESFERQREELVAKLKPSFHSIFQPFLVKYEEVDSLFFTAYTPYFNDGEACEFSVNDLWIVPGKTHPEYEEDMEDEYRYEGLSTYGSYHGTLADVVQYKLTGELPTGAVEKRFEAQKSYESYDYSARAYVTKLGEQVYEEWFRKQHDSVIDLPVEALVRTAERDADFDAIRKLFGRIPDDIIQQLFGDHIRVTITKEGVEVDEYDHD